MTPIRITVVLGAVGMTALFALPVVAAPDATSPGVNRMLAEARQATSQYQDPAAAEADGYVLDDHCVPGMGFHAVNGPLVDDQVDHREPEVLVYAPGDDGLELVAVEYLSTEPTSLFDREFDPPHDPVPWSLHAWVWHGNPEGVFNPTNPTISCPGPE